MSPPPGLRRRDAPAGLEPPESLTARYSHSDLSLFTEHELERLLASKARESKEVVKNLAWEILYRKEPFLYERLIAGERLHPGIFEWLPSQMSRAVEIGPGTGRLTMQLAARCGSLLAIEPAAPMRRLLAERLDQRGIRNVRVTHGWFDQIPVPDGWCQLTISCSSFTPHETHGGERGLAEMERVTSPGGLIVIVGLRDTQWLHNHGFEMVRFEGALEVEFQSMEEAVELAEIFYPWAAPRIRAERMKSVPYDLLEMSPPNILSWKKRQ